MSMISKLLVPLAVLFLSTGSHAKPVKLASMNIDQATPMPSLVEQNYTLAPMGFVRFCMQYPSDCSATAAEPVKLTVEAQAQLESVNRAVNRRISPKADSLRQDIWSLNVLAGDCDDYAAQKRHDLIALGWPQGALLFAAVWTPGGEAHLIVVVRTDRGDFVLDNLRPEIVQTAESRYRWEKMQSARHPLYWVEVGRPQLIAEMRKPNPAPRQEQQRPAPQAQAAPAQAPSRQAEAPAPPAPLLSDLTLPESRYLVAEMRSTIMAY